MPNTAGSTVVVVDLPLWQLRYSAKDYLNLYWPGYLGVLLETQPTLDMHTTEAHEWAERLGIPKDPQGHYPRSLWHLVFPE